MYYNKPKDFSGNTRIFWLFCFFANDKGGLFDGNTVECCADLRRYIEMNGLKHTKRKSFHQVLAVALCFCTVVTSCPGMPTVLPVFAAQTEGEGLSAPEEGTVQSATPFAEEGGTGNGTDILTGSGTGNDTDMPTEDGAGDGTDMPTEDGQGENTNTSDGNKTEDGTDVPDEDGAEADASQLGEEETDGDEEPEDDKENGQNDPADSVAEPVMTGWHFGEDAVSPQGGLFYEEETYRLILAGGSSEVQIPFEDIVSLLPTSVTVELAYPVSDSAYPDRQLSDADASGADSQTENTDAESSASLSAGETVLAVTGWSCPEYVRDGEGLLPYRGSFFFQAQLGEEGAPFAGDARIEVEVVFDEPMTLAEVTTAVPGTITSNQTWGEQTLSAGIYTIKPGVTVTLTGRLTVSENVTINGGGTIVRDAGYTIGTSGNYGDKGCFFYVKNMGTLTLENITLDGNLVNAQGPVLYIDANSTVNLRNGSVIQNNININTGGTGAYAGGAIYCGGTLNIDGGSIRNCSTSGLIENNLYANAGGAIYLRGTCKMTSGSITGNSASNGGGIYLVSSNARLTLSGGTISGNTANGNGNGIYYSTLNSATSILTIGGNVNIADVIYLDNSTGSLCPKITSELKYPISLACSSKTEGRVLAKGSGYTLTGVDASKVSMTGTTLFSKLNSADNAIVLSSVEEAEATWQETAGGEWKTGKFTTALANVYNGGTIKLLTDVLITEKVEITKQITITSNNAASPCTMTRMPKGEWGNITLSESGALTLTNVIYDGNRDFLSGAENAVKQSLIKVGSNGDTGASLTLGNGCIIRNGYKEGGSGVIAVYGTLNMAGSAVIENCEVSGTGGAVWVSASGNFTMSGGTIRGCKANGGSAVSVDGTCVLKGGSITGNMDTSDKDCAVLLRNSGSGVVAINGTSISGHANSIYNDGKRVVIAGNSQLSGAIYTTNGVSAEGSGVNALSVNIVIRMQDTAESPLALGVTVVAGSKDTTHYQLANETYGLGVSGNDLVTVISDAEKVEEAKKIVEEVLLNLTVTNDTTKQEIQDQINEALRDAGIGSDVTVTVGDFDKTNATTSATGSVSGKVTIASGSATEDVTIDKPIAKLPKTDAEKVADAKKVVEEVLSGLTATNSTTKQEIQNEINKALQEAGIGSDVTVSVGDFSKTDATSGTTGSVSGKVTIASGSATGDVTIDKPIAKLPKTDAEKVADAKKVVEEVLSGLTATNSTTKQEIQNEINKALQEAGIGSDVTVSVGDFSKTDATSGTTGSVSGKVTIASGSATGDVTIDKPIAKLPKTDAEKVADAKKVVDQVLSNLTATNDTTKQEIQDKIDEALRDAGIGSDVTVTVGDFGKENATTSMTGSIGGTVTIASGSATENVTIDKPIAKLPKTDAEKVADAKKVVEDVLSNYTATNDTTKQEIQDKIDEALRDAGIGSDVTATVSSFNKTNATSGAAGSIGGNISVASGSATENVTIDKPIAKLPDTSGGNSGSSDGNTGNGNAGGSTGNGGSAGNGGTGNTGGIGGNNGNIIAEVITQDSTPEAGFATPAEELADSSLTAEEKQQAQDGTDIRIILHVEDASARVSASEKAVVEANLQGYTVGQYLDISLYKLVGQSRTQITETTGKIRITLEIPESLRLSDTNGSNAGNAGHADGGTDAADAETPQIRQFAILRVHDGQTQILPDLDDQADTVTIETDRFSTYVLVFLDKEADDESGMNQTGTEEQSTAETGTAAGGGKDDEPKTGEVSPIQLYATLSMIAGFTYLLAYFADRRRGMSEETKKELVSKLIVWAKKGKLMRRYLALAAIFMLLVYYHSIGKKTNVEWKEVYEK